MSVLVIAEHDNGAVKPATLTTVGAAAKLGGDLHVLVVGSERAARAAEAAAQDRRRVQGAGRRRAESMHIGWPRTWRR